MLAGVDCLMGLRKGKQLDVGIDFAGVGYTVSFG